jgi:NAD(P)-dependent dehydrogenase (short-subunit alcohol dehydrogenase family)
MASTPLPSERTAIITGAGSKKGIGRGTAERLAADGWSLALLDIDSDGAHEAAMSIADRHGVRAIGVGVDISDEASVNAAIVRVEGNLPPIVGLANVAGIISGTPIATLTGAEWDRVFAVNVRGTFLMSRRVLGGMAERGLGRIVNVTSIAAQRGGGRYAGPAYSASKAAIVGFTRSLAREAGLSGITVNSVAPGPIDTDIMNGALDAERRAQLAEGTILGRIGTPAEVGNVISFLLGSEASFITGATYDVNGGAQIS